MAKNFGKRVAPKLRYKNRKIKNAPTACEEIVTAPVVEEVVEAVEENAPVEEIAETPAEEVVETVEEIAPVEEIAETPAEEVVETVEEIAPVEEIAETPAEEVVETVEEIAPVEEIAETPAEEVVETVEEIADEPVEVAEEPACEPVEEVVEEEPATDEVDETIEEVPLEMGEEEMQTVLDEEGSLDGSQEEVEDLASAEIATEEPVVETVEENAPVEEIAETPAEEVVETVEEIADEPVEVAEEPACEPVEEVVEEEAEPVEEPAPAVEEVAVTQVAQVEDAEDDEEEKEEVVEKPKKDEFTLTAPANLDDILSRICTKRARKLIYRPSDVIFSHTTTVLGTDKTNDEKIKIKSILDAEIKQGVKLGYLDKFDGLKMSELKEEYENDIVYEYADQEFKRTGILLDGDKVKVYVYDWDMKACHHVGYIDDESANLVKPYLLDSERYSFDINGIIVGGKFKKITKDEKTGKITVEKGNDGNLGLEIDINIINRKD